MGKLENWTTWKLYIWDNWEQWPSHIKELNNTDAYTLRRVTGKDRNIKWGDI